ncbi:MAG: tetratricopeptide repeat protein [Muribaculaceae bacterium]|nr:tetratricopeptide repeat protein [Muribaculaceae bacterium]
MKHLIALLLTIAATVTALGQTLAQQADSAYNREDYRSAIELYNQAIRTDGPGTDVYYNLGNAYFRNDNPGKAVVAYERALRIDPTNSDARHNLDFVRARIQDRPEDDSTFLTNLHEGIMASMTANAWAWTALAVFVLLLGAIALYIFAPAVNLRKAGFFGGIVLLFVFGYTLYVASDSASLSQSHEHAVVIVPMTQLNSVPRAARGSDDRVVPIHEGTRVEIVDSVPTPDDPVSPMWYCVKINNSTRAWLRASDVERI